MHYCFKGYHGSKRLYFANVNMAVRDGRFCKAVAQPWFTGAVTNQSIDAARRRMCVRELVIDDTGTII